MRTTLTIAGSDCSGGAGIQADLKTFSAHGIFGMSVIVSVVAENTSRVLDIEKITPYMIESQIDAVFEDIEVDSIKVGMLSDSICMQTVASKLREYSPKNIVIDPVMVAKGGCSLMETSALNTLIKEIIPLAKILTPNIPEAEAITGEKILTVEDMKRYAKLIHSMGAENVIVKGGHLEGEALDILFDGCDFHELKSERINTKNTHGTGCTFSSAIAANLALGYDTLASITKAKEYITGAIRHSLQIGKGHGPLNHFYNLTYNITK